MKSKPPEDSRLAFESSIPILPLSKKPREVGLTEIRDRGMGMNQLRDLVEALGGYVDVLKWTSGVQRLCSREFIREKNTYLASHDIEVSTGGLLERAVVQGADAVYSFFDESRELGFTTVEISSGMVVLSLSSKVALIKAANDYGLKPKPEVGMAYGIKPHERVDVSVDKLLHECQACLDAGAWKIMIEEEGLFENVDDWRTDIVFKLVAQLGLERLVFEASDVHVFNWFIYQFGPDVNLFIDVSQLSQLAAARAGTWGKRDIWGRVADFRERQ